MNWSSHQVLEKSSILLLIGILITVAIGGIVEIAPLYWLSSTIEKVQGMRPYTPLELAGRDIYIREAITASRLRACTTIRSNGGRSAPGRISRASAANIPTNGTPCT
jgi:cbb3-type cytochrome c oxidase subunit II